MLDVYIKAEGSGNPTGWSIGVNRQPEVGVQDEIVIGEKWDPQDIAFHLVPRNAADNVIFNVGDPIWVRRSNGCPQKKGLHKQITMVGQPSARAFTIRSDNSGPRRRLRYRLNFVGAAPCDPIIINGGGGVGGGGNP